MKKFILKILLLTFGFLSANNTTTELFDAANQHYQKEAYTSALQIYKSIVDRGFESSELYFNMANVYYKTNKLADAIYYYEKSLEIDPGNTDAKENLKFVQRNIVDSIEELPESFFQKINNNFLKTFSYNTWAKIAVAFSFIGTLFWLLFFFTTSSGLKKMYFTFSVFLTVLTCTGLAITYQQYSNAKTNMFAIVFANRVEVKNAPRNSANDLFNLHLGTKVKILDVVGDWNKIKIADGQVGWLLKDKIKGI